MIYEDKTYLVFHVVGRTLIGMSEKIMLKRVFETERNNKTEGNCILRNSIISLHQELRWGNQGSDG